MEYGKFAFWILPDESSLYNTIRIYRESQNIIFSRAFIIIANKKLFFAFRSQFGIEPTKIKSGDDEILLFRNVSMPSDIIQMGKTELFSYLQCNFSVNNTYCTIVICWKSKSGKVYKIDDEDIDDEDIEFWIEGLDAVKVHELLHPKIKTPLALKNLKYKLEVVSISVNMWMDTYVKQDYILQMEAIAHKTGDFINKYNETSEQSTNDERGVVHFMQYELEADHIKFSIDTGSAGLPFVKKLLRAFSRWDVFDIVKIG